MKRIESSITVKGNLPPKRPGRYLRDDDPLLLLYFEGDRLGAPAEGMPGATLDIEQIWERQQQYPLGTDESDLVRLFIQYAGSIEWDGDYDWFAAGWARFVAYHHRATTYGKTWRGLFDLVKHVEKSRGIPISHNQLLEISRDVDSAGNGLLALAYPAFLYAKEVAGDPGRMARAVTEISHSHTVAQRCVDALARYFQGEGPAVFDGCFPPEGREAEYTHLASGCLWAAWECAKAAGKEAAILRASEIGGDVDSYLSLGLLLLGWMNKA